MHIIQSSVVDLTRARKQHEELSEALLCAGVDLIELPDDNLPDSVFIEDTAVIIGKKAHYIIRIV
jgi:N-dimethylarginine dimethylaminohydrolase